MHLVFYDGECGLCDAAVRWILKRDQRMLFKYAPLSGSTAQQSLADLYEIEPDLDSLVLIENFGTDNEVRSIRSGAVFRIAWLLGGAWTLPGLLSFLPSWLFDWGYNVVARNRKRFLTNEPFCEIPTPDTRDRFID